MHIIEESYLQTFSHSLAYHRRILFTDFFSQSLSRVITSQQFFLYNSITFISISIASIPVPATHIPTINISNIQYTIPAIKGFGIFVLICATDCPTSIVQPIKVCMNDAASWKNDLQSERSTSDCTA